MLEHIAPVLTICNLQTLIFCAVHTSLALCIVEWLVCLNFFPVAYYCWFFHVYQDAHNSLIRARAALKYIVLALSGHVDDILGKYKVLASYEINNNLLFLFTFYVYFFWISIFILTEAPTPHHHYTHTNITGRAIGNQYNSSTVYKRLPHQKKIHNLKRKQLKNRVPIRFSPLGAKH